MARAVRGIRAATPVGSAGPGAGARPLQRHPPVAVPVRELIPHRRLHPAPPGQVQSGSWPRRWPDRPRHQALRHLARSAPVGGQSTAPRRRPRATAHGLGGPPMPPRHGPGDRPIRRRGRIEQTGAVGHHRSPILGRRRPRSRERRRGDRFQPIGAVEAAVSSYAGGAGEAFGSPGRWTAGSVRPAPHPRLRLAKNPSGHPRATVRDLVGDDDGAGCRPRTVEAQRNPSPGPVGGDSSSDAAGGVDPSLSCLSKTGSETSSRTAR